MSAKEDVGNAGVLCPLTTAIQAALQKGRPGSAEPSHGTFTGTGALIVGIDPDIGGAVAGIRLGGVTNSDGVGSIIANPLSSSNDDFISGYVVNAQPIA